jgi:molybdenum cofactor cytidylyltransferase
MLAAVILSGGASQRMGSPKALLPYRGQTFLEHLLAITSHPRIATRRVVLGPHAEAIRAAVPLADAEVVVNAEWEKGQLSSIHAAIRGLPPEIDGMLLFMIDHPAVSPALIAELITRFYADKPGGKPPIVGAGFTPPGVNMSTIVLPTYNGRRGHPVIFAAALFPELLAAPLDEGARAVVWAHAAEVVEVPTEEEGCILNLNDPEAAQRIVTS